ncbi:hypothetical protein GCM10022244_14310 [Streptomyces gulbargensis]|uniref:Uncharacterized protein n=1 Tax=Streptomyces gulbargensis TaxID=364901 RepID=A0ABP7LQH8_9ACTN
MARSQLAPGVEIVAVGEDGLAVRTADGEFLRVRTGDADGDALRARLAGTAPAAAPDDTDAPGAGGDAHAGPRTGSAPELDRLVAAFDAAGYLATPGPPDAARPGHAERHAAAWPAHRRAVVLLGDPVLTGPLARLLRASGADPRPGTPGEPLPADTAAVVWCLDGPVPDGLWDEADRLPERNIAWLRGHREGWQAYVEPVAALPGDVTSAHVRARRLAATPAHRELAAYWSGPRTSGAPVRLTAPAAALLAALLADDLARWATGAPDTGPLPARRRLRRVDLRTLTVTEHPVLPVPDVARPPATAR